MKKTYWKRLGRKPNLLKKNESKLTLLNMKGKKPTEKRRENKTTEKRKENTGEKEKKILQHSEKTSEQKENLVKKE